MRFVQRLAAAASVGIVTLSATDSHAWPVNNPTYTFQGHIGTTDSVVQFATGDLFLLSNGSQEGTFNAQFDMAGNFTTPSSFQTPVTDVTSGGSQVMVTATDHLQATAAGLNMSASIFAKSGGTVSYSFELVITFTTAPTNVLGGSCKVTVSGYNMSSSNSWAGHSNTAYDMLNGTSALVDDGTKSTGTVSGVCSGYDAAVNSVLIKGLDTTVRSGWDVHTLETANFTIFPTGS